MGKKKKEAAAAKKKAQEAAEAKMKAQERVSQDPFDAKFEATMAMRKEALTKVFHMFDLDGGGHLCKAELLKLGQARRKLGQQKGEWTEKSTEALIKKLDGDGDNKVGLNEFVAFFNETLPEDEAGFKKSISD